MGSCSLCVFSSRERSYCNISRSLAHSYYNIIQHTAASWVFFVKVLFFENIIGADFRAVSNLFGDLERIRFIFKDSLEKVKQLIKLRTNPQEALKIQLKLF